jgi:type II secretory ATPase GspE/PulE/Tfp pilus assembly ATPase PilB-like protein
VLHAWRSQPKGLTLYRAKGCSRCDRTGYKGRMGIYELLVADASIKRLVQARAPVSDIAAAAAAQNMRTLKQDGIEKIVRGLTDLHQVHTV